MLNIKPLYWKQIFILLLITPILTELLTNNIPARQLFKPKLFLIFMITVYGPVLLLRELAVRWKLGTTGLIIVGLAYGIYNEGLFAKTFFQLKLPDPAFNGYGYVWGTSFSWASIMMIFHAFYAFLFPVLIVYYMFPSAAQTKWMNKWVWILLSGALFLYVSYNFLKMMIPPVTVWHYVSLVAAMFILICLARISRNKKMFEGYKKMLWPFILYGFLFVIILFTVPAVMVRSNVNAGLFILYLFAVLCAAIMLLRNESSRALLVFGLAAQLAFAGSVLWVAKVTHTNSGVTGSIIFIGIFIIALVIVITGKRVTL